MSDLKIPLLREAARNLGETEEVFSNKMLYAALGADSDEERDRIRTRVSALVRTGEMVRVSRGQYTYNHKAAPSREAKTITCMWRTLKTATPGFSVYELARISGVGYDHAQKYLKALTEVGYVRRSGKKGNTVLYCSTNKLRQQKYAYQPPRKLSDPFEAEKKCLHELVGIFMQRDLHKPKTKQRVAELANSILARFEQTDGTA